MIKTELKRKFEQIFNCQPRLFRAPGRVNLIGEHTDYNEGFVLPMAINRSVYVAASPRKDSKINVYALDVNENFVIDLQKDAIKLRGNWLDYVEGVARCSEGNFGNMRGANLVFCSDIPVGAGLSSSAALTVSIGFALILLSGVEVDRQKLAFAAQTAEHEFVGIRSGIMDQFSAVASRQDQALLLDCRSLETKYIPLNFDDEILIVCDSHVKHELASSEYNTRRAECEKGVELLKNFLPEISSLRDVSEEDFLKYAEFLPQNIKRRCRHIISENVRTLQTAKLFENNNFDEIGKLMTLSHYSMCDDFEISCREIDYLVETALTIKGVYGSRMTGGGFGGCTVNLLKKESVDEFKKQIEIKFEKKYAIKPSIYRFEAAQGATEI